MEENTNLQDTEEETIELTPEMEEELSNGKEKGE